LRRQLTGVSHPHVELSEEGNQLIATTVLRLKDLTYKQHR
jgi:hypothetical protein